MSIEKNSFMNATKIKIEVVSENYSSTLDKYTVPDCVAQKILCDLIGWKEKWEFTPKDYEMFLENEKKLTNQP